MGGSALSVWWAWGGGRGAAPYKQGSGGGGLHPTFCWQ